MEEPEVGLPEVVVGDKVSIPQGSRIHFENVDEPTQAEKDAKEAASNTIAQEQVREQDQAPVHDDSLANREEMEEEQGSEIVEEGEAAPSTPEPIPKHHHSRKHKHHLPFHSKKKDQVANAESQGPDTHAAKEEEDEIKAMTTEQALAKFGTSMEGLPTAEIAPRQAKYGKNALEEDKKNPVLQFLKLMWNPLSWAMEIACILSIIVADWPDLGLILALLLGNSTIAYWEETQAGNAIAALKAQLTPKATVIRDGAWKVVDAADLVPGDIIRIKLGDVAPADLKMLSGENVKADQSALTGESIPVGKEVGDEIFSGSVIKMGEAECLVHSTGMNTFFGRTASLVAHTVRTGHFQVVLRSIGWFCIIFILIFVIAELLVQFVGRGKPCSITGSSDECPSLSNAVVLIVGGIPVAMPTVLSVTMAIGASQLAKRKAIVRRLTAVEELAGMDILCSDKTGTLTLNQLTVDEPAAFSGFTPEQVLFDAALASKHGDAIDDAIDIAIIGAVRDAGQEDFMLAHTVDRFMPFDPIGKRTEAYLRSPEGKPFRTSKGAPQVVLDISVNKHEIDEEVHRQINDFALRGLRCIGVARAEDPEGKQWVFEGLLPLFDPPREDTKETIETALRMGVRVKMITGDQLAIAQETARRLGMGSEKIHTAAAFAKAEKEELQRERTEGVTHHTVGQKSEFHQMIEDADGFAQVFPETKFEIVRRLQQENHNVGMTGDGVNDAPALKVANVGIAVAGATDAARAAADIVLMSPGLHVIIDALIGSRKIFQRMKNYAMYSISVTVRIVLTFAILTIAWDFMFPTIIVVIIAILNDGTILTISKDRVKPSPEPDQWHLPEIFVLAMLIGAYLTGGSLALFVIARDTTFFQDKFSLHTLSDPEIRGLLYLFISISGQATIFVTRSRGLSYKEKPAKLLLGAFIIAQTAATFIGVYGLNGYPNNGVQDFRGCGWGYALMVWIWTLIWYIPMDFIKMFCYKYLFGKKVLTMHIPYRFGKSHSGAFRQASKEGRDLKKKGKAQDSTVIDIPDSADPTLEGDRQSP
eukprot:Phypoly_transcript_01492.p1 GENE.Phypoly_transcript_01492~~Phypoly_transcript_01492.p1  ORF type:complete len:1043 (+),score=172.20 Phypoly_transcript_01492:156-3284(+)